MRLKDLLGEAYKEGMTEEEIDIALANKKFADLSSGQYVALGKYQELERKLQERMSEDEKRAMKEAETAKRLAELEREASIHQNMQDLDYVIDEAERRTLAELYADGKSVEANKRMRSYFAQHDDEVRKRTTEELMRSNNPTPPAGGASKTITKEQFQHMSIVERMNLFSNDRETYEHLQNLLIQGD